MGAAAASGSTPATPPVLIGKTVAEKPFQQAAGGKAFASPLSWLAGSERRLAIPHALSLRYRRIRAASDTPNSRCRVSRVQ